MYAESLLCSPEAIITLLIPYTPVQNRKIKKREISKRGKSGKKRSKSITAADKDREELSRPSGVAGGISRQAAAAKDSPGRSSRT